MRRRTLDTVVRRRGGYLIQTCSSAELLATVCLALADPRHQGSVSPHTYRRHGPGSRYLNGGGCADDRLVVSPGHYALALYSALIEVGKLPAARLDTYGLLGSQLELIGADYSPGFEVVGGSLGQGLSQAVGIALGRRMRGDSGRTFALLSDGEMQEGQTWEAVQAARHHKVSELSIIVDANGQQVDGDVTTVMDIELLEQRFRAFGVDAVTIDGHDASQVVEALSREAQGGPAVTVARTNPAQGMPPVRTLAPHRRHGLWFTTEAEFAPFASALEAMSISGGSDR
ncbi:1-deoxy-D-xylulose-5-phosphate synthase N-terminal domain-containing protein [Nocardia sp. NPDC004085]